MKLLAGPFLTLAALTGLAAAGPLRLRAGNETSSLAAAQPQQGNADMAMAAVMGLQQRVLGLTAEISASPR